MVNYPEESITPRTSVVYDTFLSVDFAKAPSNVHRYFSPNSLNMVRDEYGKVRRRMGYHMIASFSSKIWGITQYDGNWIVHTGTMLYKAPVGQESQSALLYSGMAQNVTQFFAYGGKLYILDGQNYLCYDGTACAAVSGKIPHIIIAGAPNGGGVQYEQVNLIQDKWIQSFAGDGASTVYQLAFDNLDNTPLVVEQAKLENGAVTWDTLTENTDYTVDRVNGKVTFTQAPSEPVYAQEDNVRVTASKDRSAMRERILGCTIAKGFGINGYENQLFVSANEEYKNYLFWSAIDDPTYFGDLQYAVLGQDNSAIMSFNALNTQLIIHKDTVSGQSYILSVFLSPINEIQTPQVKVEKVIGGSGCICKYASRQFGEPLFLSQLGIQAITYRDLSNYEIETMRGDRINRKLLAEPDLEKAVSCVYKYYYMLAINGNVYLLDRLNPQEEGNVLSNAYQYNAFFWNDVPVSAFFTLGNDLYFGTPDGKIMKFYTDEFSSSSYNDAGQTYEWLWEFPEYVGNLFYQNKSIKYVALRAKAYVRTTVTVDVQLEGLWYEVLTDNVSFGFLDLNDLDLNNLNLSTDTTPKKTTEKYNQRKLDKFAFRVRGNTINQPFGLYSFAFEVKEKGKHKG